MTCSADDVRPKGRREIALVPFARAAWPEAMQIPHAKALLYSHTALAADVESQQRAGSLVRSEVNMGWMLMPLFTYSACVPHYIHSAYYWAGTAPDMVSCVRQSPTNAWPACSDASHALHPPPLPAGFVSHRPDKKFAIVLGLLHLAFAFAARREQVLGVGEGRAGLGWSGLVWAGLRRQPPAVQPQLFNPSFSTFRGTLAR